MNTILMIAFDYPPRSGAGIERTLKFARYLSEFGWRPVVLTVNESTHGNFVENTYDIEDENIIVVRTFCLDASKHLAVKGRYFSFTKKPDRYWGWIFTAVPTALRLIKKYDIQCIWSTYPIITSHIIGYVLSKFNNLPWIADYRDPLQCYYDKSVYGESKLARFFDKLVVQNVTKLVFVTQEAKDLYCKLFGSIVSEKAAVIENGFDSENMNGKKRLRNDNKFIVFHGGSLYENGRQPKVLFEALSLIKRKNLMEPENLQVHLVGANNQRINENRAANNGTIEMIRFLPQLSYDACLEAILNADVLVVIQGQIFNSQIPGKIYEYLCTDLPIVVITPKGSATDRLIQGYPGVLSTEDAQQVAFFIAKHFKERQYYKRDTEALERRQRTIDLKELIESSIKSNTI